MYSHKKTGTQPDSEVFLILSHHLLSHKSQVPQAFRQIQSLALRSTRKLNYLTTSKGSDGKKASNQRKSERIIILLKQISLWGIYIFDETNSNIQCTTCWESMDTIWTYYSISYCLDNFSTSGDNTVDIVGINETTDWNLLKTILKASNSTFFKMSSAKTATWKYNSDTREESMSM